MRASPGVADEAESSGESGDEYVQEKAAAKAKPNRRRSRRVAEEGERQPKQRKRKRKQPEEIDLSTLTPEEGAYTYCYPRGEAHSFLQPASAGWTCRSRLY